MQCTLCISFYALHYLHCIVFILFILCILLYAFSSRNVVLVILFNLKLFSTFHSMYLCQCFSFYALFPGILVHAIYFYASQIMFYPYFSYCLCLLLFAFPYMHLFIPIVFYASSNIIIHSIQFHVLAPGSAHARPSAWPLISMHGNCPPHMSAESPSNISPNPQKSYSKFRNPRTTFENTPLVPPNI